MRKSVGRPALGDMPAATRAPPVDRRPMPLTEAWALLKVPASETGVQTYYRTLLNRPADAESLVQALEALRLGELARINLIASLALSPEARTRGRTGAGVALIRGVNSAFERSGMGARVRRRRAAAYAAEAAALERRDARTAARSVAPGPDASGLAGRVALLEELLAKAEVRLQALARERPAGASDGSLEARVIALESAVRALLEPPVR